MTTADIVREFDRARAARVPSRTVRVRSAHSRAIDARGVAGALKVGIGAALALLVVSIAIVLVL